MIIFKWIFILVLLSANCFASLTAQLQGIYNSDSDNTTNFSYTKTHYSGYIAGSFGSNNRFYIGQNIGQYSRNHRDNGGTSNQVSVLEIGPKILLYFGEMKTLFVAATWNPYARGTKTDSTGSYDLTGSSYMATIGYHARVSRSIGIGVSINYHTLAIEKTEKSGTSTNVSQSYTSISPMLEMAFHFR